MMNDEWLLSYYLQVKTDFAIKGFYCREISSQAGNVAVRLGLQQTLLGT